jgi:CHAD domain-containing protein
MKLKRKGSVPAVVKRTVRKRIDAALETVDVRPEALIGDAAIHAARKQLKRSRGLIRVVRDELGRRRFARTNRRLRDASRPLSNVRDAKVLIETLEILCNTEGLPQRSAAPLRKALEARRRQVRQRVLKDRHTRQAMVKKLRQGSRIIASWSPAEQGWKALGAGLGRTYRQGRAAMKVAVREATDAALHESRKRTKDLLYVMEFLVHVRPEALQPIVDDAHALTDLLGDDHDLAVLQTVVDGEPELRLPPARRRQLKRLVARRRSHIQQTAHILGRRLFAQTGAQFVDRIHGFWLAWRRKGRSRRPEL